MEGGRGETSVICQIDASDTFMNNNLYTLTLPGCEEEKNNEIYKSRIFVMYSLSISFYFPLCIEMVYA